MADENLTTNIHKSLQANLAEITTRLGNPPDLQTDIYGTDHCLGVVYLDSLTNEVDLRANLLQPVLPLLEERNRSLAKIAPLIPGTGLHQCADFETIISDILQGRAVIFLDKETTALSFKFPGWAKHDLKEPKSEQVVRGPREGFTENIHENIGIIRRWIQDQRLRADSLETGRRTKTKVAVVYLADVAQSRMVREVKQRIAAIDIDGVIESSYIEHFIKDRRRSLFPLTQATERTDKAVAAILNGRVAILVDKSPYIILVPVTLNELYQAAEDYYIDFWLGSLTRMIRFIGNLLAIGLPGLYIALVSVNPGMLPIKLALMINNARSNAPLSIIVEMIILDIMIGIFFEAGLRFPGNLSQTIGAASGVVLGLIGVISGIVSAPSAIVVAITSVASYAGPNYPIGLVWRFLKYIMIFAAALFGFFGLTIAGILILAHTADLKSFGVSYMAPWAPLQWPELTDSMIRAPFWSRWRWHRPKTYRPQDSLRSGGTKRKDDEND